MTGYTRTRIWLHWIVAILVLLQWLSADGIGRAMDVLESQDAPVAWDFVLTNLHLFCGGLILVLTVWRLRLRRAAASPMAVGSRFQQLLVVVTHWALLVVLLLLPLSGALSYYRLIPAAERWHEVAGWVLMGLIILHLLGLIWHSLRGHAIWRRMVTIWPKAPQSVDSDTPKER